MYYLSALSSFSLNDNAKIRWFYLAMMPNKTCHEKWCQMMRNDAFWLHHFAKSTSPPLPLKVFFRKPTSPPLPLREGPPLISVFSPQGRRGNRPTRCSNRYAIRLADHQRSSPAAELHFAVCDRMDMRERRSCRKAMKPNTPSYMIEITQHAWRGRSS